MPVWVPELDMEMPFFQYVAYRVETQWNTKGNCGLVAGATYPADIVSVRNAMPEAPILVPSVGKQGGDLEAAVRAAANSKGQGFSLNVSSALLFAYKDKRYEHFGEEDFAGAARQAALDSNNSILAALENPS